MAEDEWIDFVRHYESEYISDLPVADVISASFLSPEVRSRAMCSAENLQVSLPRGCFSTPSDTFGWGVTPDFRLGVTYAAHPVSHGRTKIIFVSDL